MSAPATPAQIIQWQAWLAAAQAAYQQLMIGQAVVELAVDGNTFLTRFQRADADRLAAWIARLQGWLDAAATPCPAGAAIGFVL
jgi:hypothetical protein